MCPAVILSENAGGFKPLPRITSGYNGPPGEGLPFFAGKSLEEEVAAGDSRERDRAQLSGAPYQVPTSINAAPVALINSLRWMRQKASSIETMAAACRYASRCGLGMIRRIEALSALTEPWEKAYLNCDELGLGGFVHQEYPGFRGLSSNTGYLKAAAFLWVAGALSDMATDTGLARSTIMLASLTAGLAQSVDWIPAPYVTGFRKAVLGFARYLEGRARALVPG